MINCIDMLIRMFIVVFSAKIGEKKQLVKLVLDMDSKMWSCL